MPRNPLSGTRAATKHENFSDRISNIVVNHEKPQLHHGNTRTCSEADRSAGQIPSQAAFSVPGAFRSHRDVRDTLLVINGMDHDQIIIPNGDFSIWRQFQADDFQQKPSRL
jgi:hypothetical protein